ncbi:AbrB/MazE/SpoVT family DNA-binding domain-containing protein [Candidatus Woesearchaeota archaeon]|nr:AbrB/MazE/SpoVT family DNA-binding domain-containing protein [Candidatus Woesearchaeota archaeon]
METRKIISFGNSSYVVSLPKDWVKENKLSKGDLLHMDQKNDEILIYPGRNGEKKIEPKTIIIEGDGKDYDMIQTEIVSAYLNNYDVIEVRGKLSKERAVHVKSLLRNLSGIEIIRQDAQKITAKDLLNINEISIETLIRRMDNIIRSMLTDSIQSIKEDMYEEIYERDQDVNRLVFLAYRVLRAAIIDSKIAKNLQKANIELLFSQVLIEKLEKVADKSKRIARYLKEANLKQSEKEEVTKMYESIKGCYLEVMKAYYKKDLDLAFKAENAGFQHIKKLNKLIKERQNAPAHMVVEQMKSMVISIKNIARAVIGMEKNVW